MLIVGGQSVFRSESEVAQTAQRIVRHAIFYGAAAQKVSGADAASRTPQRFIAMQDMKTVSTYKIHLVA
jgi:hypothetical protein